MEEKILYTLKVGFCQNRRHISYSGIGILNYSFWLKDHGVFQRAVENYSIIFWKEREKWTGVVHVR